MRTYLNGNKGQREEQTLGIPQTISSITTKQWPKQVTRKQDMNFTSPQ